MKKVAWLYLSSFGIMFSVLSWLQEGGLLPSGDNLSILVHLKLEFKIQDKCVI